jgi:hypothetical protein
VDGIWVWSVVCSGIAISASTLFRVVCDCPRGLLNTRPFGKLFLSFLPTAPVNGGLPAQQRTFLRGKLAAQPRTQRLFTSW